MSIKNSCALLREVQHPTGGVITRENDPNPDPDTEVETAMIIGAGRRGHLRLGEGGQLTVIAIEKDIAPPDTPVEAEATVAVAAEAIDAGALTDKKVERS